MTLLKTRYNLLANFAETARKIYYYEQLIQYLHDGNVPPPTFQYGFYGQELYQAYWAILQPDPRFWDDIDERLLSFATTSGKAVHYLLDNFYERWLNDRVNESIRPDAIEQIVSHLALCNVTESDFWLGVNKHLTLNYLPNSALADWVLARLEKYHATALPKLGYEQRKYLQWVLKRKPDFVKAHLSDFLALSSYNDALGFDVDTATILLKHDAVHTGAYLANLKSSITDPDSFRNRQRLLANHLPDQYEANSLQDAYDYLACVRQRIATPPKPSASGSGLTTTEYGPVGGRHRLTVEVMIDRILRQEEPTKARTYLYDWLRECTIPDPAPYHYLAEKLGQDSVPFLLLGLYQNPNILYVNEVDQARHILKLLALFDYSAYYPQIWALARHKSKQMRELAAVTLAKLGDAAIPEARKLLTDKKADFRQTGALILSLIRTDQALQLLRDALDAEKNDDARDLMLDGLTGLLPVPTNPAEIADLVQKARQRGKLDTPAIPFLVEKDLPALYWQHQPEPLAAETVRFLLYRQNRSKDIRPDPEARPIYALIDRGRSEPFARAVLKAYFEGGAEPKHKGCLTVGAMLGGDDESDRLKGKVTAWADAGRGKMAEYAVQALALIGSNKALRAVEFFARKYKNKNKNVGAAANEAFGIAAETLGTSPFDLADSIIPDFGFEGLFRTFAVGGETYRAFVGSDFKLAFLNEDNKLLKSLPKAAPADLKDEFKEIGKEIRDIVKAQSGRLEQYLVTQRKWPAENWLSFFLGNPVMFTYATRLIWGGFDADGKLLFTFQCLDDQTLVDDDGLELELSVDTQIGMVHPLSLTTDDVARWAGQLADADVEPIFPQLARQVVTLPENDCALTMDTQFAGVEYGGYGFVSKMEKTGWFRGSVQDSGWIASFYKDFADVGLQAIVLQQGNICVGYYDEPAALGPVLFVKSGSVQFGNYSYDEPDKPDDKRLIPFGQVPPIVYSEVMADLVFFRENDQRKQA